MQTKPPKNDRNHYWTMHSQRKLLQYGLTPNRIKRIIKNPDRKEEGIALRTIAVMQRKNKKDPKKGEIWVMYQKNIKTENEKRKTEKKECLSGKWPKKRLQATSYELQANASGRVKIISAWVYPAETPKGKEIFIPDEAWEELQK